MTNILFQISNKNVTVETIRGIKTDIFSIWFFVALIELIIILFLVFRFMKNKNNLKDAGFSKDKIREAKNSNIDMNNLMDSINNSKKLYKELSRACHPDRFINSEKEEKAKDIFQEISKNKRDFEKLVEIKETALNELNIKIKNYE